VATDSVGEFMRLAQIPRENAVEIEEFLRTQQAESNTLAVLERPDQPVALLKIEHDEATLFSVLPSQRGSNLVHETYIGKVPDATITQVHAIETLADASALRTERVEIAGSRLAGTISLANYTDEERTTLIDVLRRIAGPWGSVEGWTSYSSRSVRTYSS
jgi:hypothetical protein